VQANEILLSVREALSRIIDPETRLDIGRMNLIHEIVADQDGCVSLVFRPSSPVCPMAYSLANSIKKELLAIDSVKSVRIRVENFNKANHLESIINAD
jgi:metal-sulfur cluster biosynthetic enzyme